MAQRKQYQDTTAYEQKLQRVMDRFGVKDYNYNFDRHGCFIDFEYKNNMYRFEHSVEKAKSKGIKLTYGSDAFAQLVLALEDLARLAERGIYDLQTWVEGMKFLPPVQPIPHCFKLLGFTEIPPGPAEVHARFRTLAKIYHPDIKDTGDPKTFMELSDAAEQAKQYFDAR
jgi:hypothetical protein